MSKQSTNDVKEGISGGEAILRSLKANGIDYLFINPGSDFAPIIEALASAHASEIPQTIACIHENLVVTMAHGYYLATGKMQAAAVHVNVGMANAVMGMLNAHSDNIPIFLISGRNPLTEGARLGSRRTPIQYGQEMFDQTAMVREAVKWDYELRYAENAADLVSRACAIANMEPHGSVYMSLPREPLCETTEMCVLPTQVSPSIPQPDSTAITLAAEKLASAKNPVIICSRGDPQGELGEILQALALENSIAVSEVYVTRNVLPSQFKNNIGGNIAAHLRQADVVLVIDTPVAWIEARVSPAADAEIIHLGPDPLFTRIPVRGYRNTQAIQCNTVAGIRALREAMPAVADAQRQTAIEEKYNAFSARTIAKANATQKGLASKAWVAACVSEVVGDGAIFSERGGPKSLFNVKKQNQWFGNTQAGGLGWALPAALGFQLANKERLTICIVGDGSYMFANPVACHQLAEAQQLPVLTIVLNNGGWDAVRTSTLDVYPDGAAARANHVPTVPFLPTPDFAAIASSCGCYSECVEQAQELPQALERAVGAVKNEKKQALIEIKIGLDDGEK